MNALGNLTCKPSGYPEYDNLSGYVSDVYTLDWTGADGTLWRKIVTVINLGRPDRGVPADPGEAMASEEWGERVRPGYAFSLGDAHEAHRQAARERHVQIQMRVVAYLMAHGPTSCNVMALELGVSKHTLMPHLKQREGSAYVRIRKGHETVWGVVGVHVPEVAS